MTIREFLDINVKCNYIEIINNSGMNKILWEGKCETIDNYIPKEIAKLKLIKWSVKDNGIVLWVNL